MIIIRFKKLQLHTSEFYSIKHTIEDFRDANYNFIGKLCKHYSSKYLYNTLFIKRRFRLFIKIDAAAYLPPDLDCEENGLMLILYLGMLETPEEKDKFEELYNKYRRLMLYAANNILHDDFLAEDAVHQAFLKIIPHLHKLTDISCHKTKTYVVIVVENVSRTIYAKKKKLELIITSTEDIDEETGLEITLEDTYFEKYDSEAIGKAIEQLPDIYRQVLVLHYYIGNSDKEIAMALDLNASTVRKRLERARQKLMVLLEREV